MIGKQRRKWQALVCVGAVLTASLMPGVWAGENESKDPVDGMNRENGFWAQDVWADPARPFLFYGKDRPQDERVIEAKKEEKQAKKRTEEVDSDEALAIFPVDGLDRAAEGELLSREMESKGLATLKSLKTVKELREEVNRRLDAAVMQPTPAAIGLYLQANAFLMQKAGVFAESWRRALVDNPQFDWTAVRPAVNVVSAGMNREREGRLLREVRVLAKDHGFIFFGDESLKTRHMLEQLRAFKDEYGFDAAFVSVTGADNPLMPEAREDKGLSAFVAQGIRQFPALVLVSRHQKDLTKAKLVATGAADAMTLVRNTHAAAIEMADDLASTATRRGDLAAMP